MPATLQAFLYPVARNILFISSLASFESKLTHNDFRSASAQATTVKLYSHLSSHSGE
ncbi:hypothetical protein VPMS16_184 [Vibrio sp. 16]|nr:hypothetical protein VPMS16_184 [Vibrio sp. 16]